MMRPVAFKNAIKMHFTGLGSPDMNILEMTGMFVLLYNVNGDAFWWGNTHDVNLMR